MYTHRRPLAILDLAIFAASFWKFVSKLSRGPLELGIGIASTARRTNEEILDSPLTANNGDIYINAHVNKLENFPASLPMIPVVRGWKKPMYFKVPRQALAEIIERLHIAIWPVYT